jgi:eukaryotic-like serine/threonine-protein kinase
MHSDTAPVAPVNQPLEGSVLLAVTPAGGLLQVHVGRALASGGIGVVHAGRTSLGDVAVKVLQERHGGDAGIASRFEREIQYAFRMRHPNVIAAHAAGHLPDGRPFYVMDRLEGMTLGQRVRTLGPLSIAEGLRLADQILAGLAAVHEARIVHRDVQPDNVFVSRGPDGAERATILDFGFAQEPGVDIGDGLTPDSPGSLVGTLTFMAPEQATRSRAITQRSDLFGVAVLLYYAFSGKLPFRGGDDLDVLVSVVRAPPVPLRRVRRDAPAALEALLGRALAKHPDARFGSADEMRAALARVACPRPGRPASASAPPA